MLDQANSILAVILALATLAGIFIGIGKLIAVNSGGTLTYTADTTGVRTVTVNAGGVINKGGFTHTGTVFVNNGGTINA